MEKVHQAVVATIFFPDGSVKKIVAAYREISDESGTTYEFLFSSLSPSSSDSSEGSNSPSSSEGSKV